MSSPHLKKLEAYTMANREAAAIVLAAVERFGGEGSLMVTWARAVTANATVRTAEKELPLWRAA